MAGIEKVSFVAVSDCIILGVMLRPFVFFISLLLSLSASADHTQIPDYRTARGLHWTELYPNGGWTLYCGEYFEDRSSLSVEHIYPASWMAEYLDCGSRKQCRQQQGRVIELKRVGGLHHEFVRMAA